MLHFIVYRNHRNYVNIKYINICCCPIHSPLSFVEQKYALVIVCELLEDILQRTDYQKAFRV